MQSLIDTLTCFNTALSTGKSTLIHDHMSCYDGEMAAINRDFYTTTIDSDDQINELVQAILINLHVHPHQWGRYLGARLTVYDFLVELRESNSENNKKLKEFIELIDDKTQMKWLKFIMAGMLALTVIEITLPAIAMSVGLTTVQALLTTALFAPVVGTIYTAAIAIYSLYTSLSDRKISFFQRFQDNFFLLAHLALKFAAYGLLLAAVTTAAPIPAILFVVSAVVSVLKEVVSLVQMMIQDMKKPAIPDHADLGTLQEQARHEFDYKKKRNSVLINMAVAAVYVGLVAAMCFVPGGPFVAIGVLAAMGVVHLAKMWAHKLNETAMRSRMRSEFEEIELAYTERQALQQGNEWINSEDHSMQVACTAGMQPTSDLEWLPSKQLFDDKLSRPSQAGMFAASAERHSSGAFTVEKPDHLTVLPADLVLATRSMH